MTTTHSAQAGSVQAGAAAAIQMLKRINDATTGHFERAPLDADGNYIGDPRDYVEVARIIDECLQASCVHGSDLHKQGFLRALSDLFCLEVDGCGIPLELTEWDPLAATEQSFSQLREAGHGR